MNTSAESQKLFSNLELSGDRLQHSPGSRLSSSALIAGTTIGAGILALPAATLPAGLIPSTLLMVGVWLYMAVSGLLIAEVNLQTMRQLGKPYMGFMGTAQHHLGKGGSAIATILYVFNHYALLIAYTARGGDILASALGNLEVRLNIAPAMPLWWGHIIFAAILGSVLFFSSQRFIGQINSTLLAIVIISFIGLLLLIAPQVHLQQLAAQHWNKVSIAIPVMFVAFVYHNVVPVVTTQLEGDRTKIRQSIFFGSLIPLIMFLIWNALIIGSIEAAIDPIEQLRSGISNPSLGIAVSIFSEFAIITSFIGFVYGLVSFFEDISNVSSCPQSKKFFIYSLVIIPPIVPSILNPNIFLDAMDLAGAFGISVLFGIIPAAMAWKQRYQTANPTSSNQMVWGGKTVLAIMIGLAVAVIAEHLLVLLNVV